MLARAGDSPGDQGFPPGRRVQKRQKNIQEESSSHNKKKSFKLDALVHSAHQVSQAKVSSGAAGQACSIRYCKPCGDPDLETAVDEEVTDPRCSQPECAQASAVLHRSLVPG